MQRNGKKTKKPDRPGITLRGVWYGLLLLAVLGLALFFASKMLFGAALGMLGFAALDIGAAKKQSGRLSGLHAESGAEGFLLSLPAGGGKPNGLAHTLAHLGLTREQSIAFGDGGNDVTMLEYAGIGVAMGNACDAAKAAADYVTDDITADGLAKALAHFGLI